MFDAYVPVDGDDTKAKDGRGAAEHIHSSPDVTEHPAKHPAAQNLQGRRERQHDNAQQQVCNGQVDNEEVGDGLEMLIAHYRQDNQNVPNDCHQNKDGENDPDPDNLRVRGEVGARRGAVVEKYSVQNRSIKCVREIDATIAFVPQVRVCHFEAP